MSDLIRQSLAAQELELGVGFRDRRMDCAAIRDGRT